jgi:hypothetical protein
MIRETYRGIPVRVKACRGRDYGKSVATVNGEPWGPWIGETPEQPARVDQTVDGGDGWQPFVTTDLDLVRERAAAYHADMERVGLTNPWSGVGGWRERPLMEESAGGRMVTPRQGFSASFDAGWVDPLGVYHPASEGAAPVDAEGYYDMSTIGYESNERRTLRGRDFGPGPERMAPSTGPPRTREGLPLEEGQHV